MQNSVKLKCIEELHPHRIIKYFVGEKPGPCLVFFGGIHGNEASGVKALEDVAAELGKKKNFCGQFIAIRGNIKALAAGQRFIKEDLNRLWKIPHFQQIASKNIDEPIEPEWAELKEIYDLIHDIISTENGPFYFFDLHTTSSETFPFLTVNDSSLNRKFTKQYPLPIILGIEEYLEGPLLSYINELGYVSFGFEGGQHTDSQSIFHHKAFIYLSMVFTGFVSARDIHFKSQIQALTKKVEKAHVFEISYRHHLSADTSFQLIPGFTNFQKIKKGQLIAIQNEKEVHACQSGRIFMPLYQEKGEDGFFIIQKTPPFFFILSLFLRTIKLDHVLVLLPGIRWVNSEKNELEVNLKIARFLAKPFFHLLGYRSRQVETHHLRIKNRESASREREYQGTPWY